MRTFDTVFRRDATNPFRAIRVRSGTSFEVNGEVPRLVNVACPEQADVTVLENIGTRNAFKRVFQRAIVPA